MRFTKFLLMSLVALCTLLPCSAQATGITNYPVLVTPEYWMNKNTDGDKLILDANGVQSFNAKIRQKSRTVVDLANYPGTFNGDSLKTKIMDYSLLDDDLYLHGVKVSDNYKNILRKQTNVGAIPASVNVRYAVTVRRSPLRNLPTGEGLYYYANDKDFDALQETMLDPSEPVAVLHTSANGYFYYVQSVNYSGWVSKYALGFTDKNTWLTFVKPAKFLVVTDADYILKTSGENVLYQQGARLVVTNDKGSVYTVVAPGRSQYGSLVKQPLSILKTNNALHYGYMPYTSNNIVRAAFKFYGRPYGWGGLKNSVDCSSLLYNAYRTVGIVLPRNADEQELSAGTKHALSGVSGNRISTLDGLMPGAGLYMEGHCMMYLGSINKEPYVIHSLGSHFEKGVRQREMSVVVSDLNLHRASGNSFLNELTTAVEYK